MWDVPPRPDLEPLFAPPPPASPEGGRSVSSWGWWEAVGVYLLAFIVGGIASIPALLAFGPASPNGELDLPGIVATIVADVAITSVLVFWLARWHREWRGSIVLVPAEGRWSTLAFGVISGVLLVPAIGFVDQGLQALFEAGLNRQVHTPRQVAPGLSPGAEVLLVLLACFVAPIAEEFFFRGVLFRTVRDRHGFWLAALASAIPFGLVHYVPSPWQDALLLQSTMVATGVGLAWIYERRGTVMADIAAHMTFNVIGVALILSVAR